MWKRKLAKLFDAGRAVKPLHLLGKNESQSEWTVRLHTGPVLDLGFRRHRARFWAEGATRRHRRVAGCNVTGRDREWGHFDAVPGTASAGLNFGDERNHSTRRLYVELRDTSYTFLVVGKLYVMFFGKRRFVGYLTLRRRGDRRRAPVGAVRTRRFFRGGNTHG